MTKNYRVYVKCNSRIREWNFNPRKPNGVTYRTGRHSNMTIRLKSHDDDGFGHWNGLDIDARKSFLVPKTVYRYVETRNKNNINDIDFSKLHSSIQKWAKQISSSILSDLESALSLHAWRHDLPSFELLASATYWGSKSRGLRYTMPSPKHVQRITAYLSDDWAEADKNELWASQEKFRPLQHELYQEAFSLYKTVPRSAVLIGYTALEVGVKKHCQKLRPDNTWILGNIQSPPLPKIIKEYLPLIHDQIDQGKWEKESKQKRSTIHSWMEIRNALAHGGEFNRHNDALRSFLVAVKQFLYLFDVLEGHKWAEAHVGDDLLKAANLVE